MYEMLIGTNHPLNTRDHIKSTGDSRQLLKQVLCHMFVGRFHRVKPTRWSNWPVEKG